ncbi:MAG: MFS transporter [Gammaproteobacteria bacterium]|nr:MFS transporter [Gammaproteobacteria bacterium]MDE2023454.1 MFS transporter [Gammaproteobacteria bacterium]
MNSPPPNYAGKADTRSRALRFVLGIGIVSLFADFTYEGGRGIVGPYLAVLGAGPVFVGVVAGLGEFLGYGVRLLSGRFVDRTRCNWQVMGAGYAVNLLAVPALALAPLVWVAGLLVFLERIGKGVRNPAKDALLSRAGRELGHGYAFGLHEFLDQLGAVAGPLLVAGVIALSAHHGFDSAGTGYRVAFAVLLIPALLALFFLWRARGLEPEAAPVLTVHPPARFGARYYFYMAFAVVSVLGFSHFILVAYHLQVTQRLTPVLIPVLFGVAMGADALAAIVVGRFYDRFGLKVLYALPLLTLPTLPLLFLSVHPLWIWMGAVLWGAALGVQESTVRAGVATLTPENLRGTAYGLFDTVFGAAWFAGSVMLGALYAVSPLWLVVAAMLLQLAALPLLATLNFRVAS